MQQLGVDHRIEFVSDGQQLMDRLADAKPSLVVLDLNMLGVTGMQALRKLHAAGSLGVPIVVFSTSHEAEEVEACRELGVVDSIAKPGNLAEFHGAVARILAHAA